MSYTTHDDVAGRLGPALYVQLTDDAGSGAADASRVEAARREADAEIDSHLGRRYAVPVEVGTDERLASQLRRIAVDLAVFRLHGRRPPIPDDVRRERDAAIRWLERVASGHVALPARARPAGAEALRPGVVGPARRLTRDTLRDL